MVFREPITFDELLNCIRSKEDLGHPYCVYGIDENDPNLDTFLYIDNYPDINDEDEEVYPKFVIEQGLEFLYRDELLQDVVANAVHQKSDVSNKEVLEAIKYYSKRDSFMQL